MAEPESCTWGRARELTILFTDLANFTAMSEGQTPEQTVAILTEYFGAMTPSSTATVARWTSSLATPSWRSGRAVTDGAHAEHAVRAAIDMQAAMGALVRDLTAARGLPPIAMRVGCTPERPW